MSECAPDSGGVHIKTLGCKVNQSESTAIRAQLAGFGVKLTDESGAGVIILDTCTVTAEADRKARKYLRRVHTMSTSPAVVVIGCMAALDDGRLSALGDRVEVLGDKTKVAERVIEILAERGHDLGEPVSNLAFPRTRIMLKVQDGCDAGCAYCIVPFARGAPRSTPLADVIVSAEKLVALGAPEIVLTGINLGRYSDSGADIATLVREVSRTGVTRVRLSSIEPVDITERLLEVMAFTPSVCRQLHVPLQSGSDRVLAAMGRSYTTAEYRRLVDLARGAISGLAVTTDLICGFPTETEVEARETIDYCREIGFSGMHVFRFSPRHETAAAKMGGRVDPRVISERAGKVRRLAEELRSRFLAAKIGSVEEVLVESAVNDSAYEGTTSDYAKVRFDGGVDVRSGDLVSVKIEALVSGVLKGTDVAKISR